MSTRWGRLAFLVLAATALALAACGDFGLGDMDFSDTDWNPYGTLEITNSPLSTEDIVQVRIIQGTDVITEVVDIPPGSLWRKALLPDVYDVEVTWTDTTVHRFDAVVIERSELTPIVAQED